MTRVAKLAEKEGSRTRAILKIAGRGAIMVAALASRRKRLAAGCVLARVRLRIRAQEVRPSAWRFASFVAAGRSADVCKCAPIAAALAHS